jgi:hypothetical protein
MTTTKEIVRTAWHGTYEIVSDSWGTRLQRTYDPEGVEVNEDELREFELNPQFAPIPKTLLDRIISFFSSFQIESQVILIRHVDDLRIWDALVPRQQNTMGSTSSDKTDLISLTTGEKYTGTPNGWVESGSVHSHPTMKAFWSGIDDASELKWTGVHITVGGDWRTKQFTICTSICIGGNRYVFAPNVLCEGNFARIAKDDPEHRVRDVKLVSIPDAIKSYVTQKVYVAPKTKTNTFNWWQKHAQPDWDFYADPFAVSDTYNANKLRKFDECKKLNALKDGIDDYLIGGGNPEILRQHITETIDEIFSWYNV